MRKAVIAALALGLAGCGGTTEPGGPLQVVSVTPATLAANVPVTDTIIITFSKALRPSSVNDTTIVLSRGGLRAIGTTTLSGDARSVSIVAALGNNQFYVLEVRTGVEDAAGYALSEPYVTAFSTVRASPASATDPVGDTYNAASTPDVVSLTATPGQDTVTFSLVFSGTVSPTTSGLPNATGALIDIDVDQDPQTGLEALTDAFGPPGTSTGLGIEYYVSLFVDAQGNALVSDIATGAILGLVPTVFGPNSMTVKVPLAMLGHDDGNMNVAAVAGNLTVPTDVVPNVGHVTLGTSGQVGGSRSAAALRAGHTVRAGPIGVWGR